VTPGLTTPRAAAAVWVLLMALVLQASVLPHLAFRGVVPDVILLVVVAVGLRHGSEAAMVLGFAGGLLLDLVPPADHVAGRWALALLVAGYLSGRVSGRAAGRVSTLRWPVLLGAVATCAFVATSVFALTGLVLRDPLVGVPALLETVLVAVVSDVLLGALLVPLVLVLDERLEPDRDTPRRSAPPPQRFTPQDSAPPPLRSSERGLLRGPRSRSSDAQRRGDPENRLLT
jgi:rod shape-determining protein MreD